MENQIIGITRQRPEEVKLPDGCYVGILGGDTIELTYQKVPYALKINEGVRGINIQVVVNINNGIATYETIKNSW